MQQAQMKKGFYGPIKLISDKFSKHVFELHYFLFENVTL